MTKAVELVFIPVPALGHLVPAVEAAKHLLVCSSSSTGTGTRLTVTILLIKPAIAQIPGDDQKSKMASIMKETPGLRFIDVPLIDHDKFPAPSETFCWDYNDSHVDEIRQLVSNLIEQPSVPGSRLAGLIVDMFCTKFIEVAEEFSIPSYIFTPTSASSIGLSYDLISLKFEHNQDLTQYKNSDSELSIRCFSQPLPAQAIPSILLDDGPLGNRFLQYFKRHAKTKGILINTFYELESYAIKSLWTTYDSPKVYPIGPLLIANPDFVDQSGNELMNWLDNQPENSVVFLCFGTLGAFDNIQVKEFAKALENSQSRFVWSLRKPKEKGKEMLPGVYDNFEEVLPEGFLERTMGVGRVIGWAPQTAVLAHVAVGGFITHCGWSSVLESVWHGVPMVAFPLYADHRTLAFQLVKELGIAEEIRIGYNIDLHQEVAAEVVPAEEIEAAIRRVMVKEGSGVREKVKEMQRKSREALEDGGSSYKTQLDFIQDMMRNIGEE